MLGMHVRIRHDRHRTTSNARLTDDDVEHSLFSIGKPSCLLPWVVHSVARLILDLDRPHSYEKSQHCRKESRHLGNICIWRTRAGVKQFQAQLGQRTHAVLTGVRKRPRIYMRRARHENYGHITKRLTCAKDQAAKTQFQSTTAFLD